MIVTKLIREYVEKRVREAYPKSEAELRWEAKTTKMNEAIEKANDLAVEYAQQIVEKLNAEFGFSGDYVLKAYDNNYRNFCTASYYGDCEDYQASRKAGDERRKKIAETIEEILINLELGGTKAELEEMLTNINK